MVAIVNSLQGILVSLFIVAGLIVLMALGIVTVTAGLPPLLLLGGLHINTTPTGTTTAVVTPPIQ